MTPPPPSISWLQVGRGLWAGGWKGVGMGARGGAQRWEVYGATTWPGQVNTEKEVVVIVIVREEVARPTVIEVRLLLQLQGRGGAGVGWQQQFIINNKPAEEYLQNERRGYA